MKRTKAPAISSRHLTYGAVAAAVLALYYLRKPTAAKAAAKGAPLSATLGSMYGNIDPKSALLSWQSGLQSSYLQTSAQPNEVPAEYLKVGV